MDTNKTDSTKTDSTKTDSKKAACINWLTHHAARFFTVHGIPQQCYLCHQPSSSLCCEFCTRDLPTTASLITAPAQPNLLLNPTLKAALAQPEFQQLIAPMRYQWPVNTLLQDFKYHRKDQFASLFSRWMQTLIQQAYQQNLPDFLVPVPQHPLRLLRRYYNQADVLAHALAQEFNIPVASTLCKRVSHQRSQTRFSGKERRKKLQNAFAVDEKAATRIDNNSVQHIAIVDDVITTASTANAVATALTRRFPAAKIDVWAVAISV